MRSNRAWWAPWLLLAAGCRKETGAEKAQPAASAAPSTQASTAPSAAPARPLARRLPWRREGQALVRGEGEAALYLADEDHKKLRRIELTSELTRGPETDQLRKMHQPNPISPQPTDALIPESIAATEASIDLPGAPAQALSLGDRVLVTVRDPGLLLVIEAGPSMRELGRVELPPDAWGLAVSDDGAAAYVTSAWGRRLSKVTLGDRPQLAWSTPLAREPRGVAVHQGKAYVTHLIGAELSIVDVSAEPRVERVFLPPDPLSTFSGEKLTATLGYAAALSPDGHRLFVARHAMGSFWSWQGKTTVDVLDTASQQPLAPVRKGRPYGTLTQDDLKDLSWLADHSGTRAESDGHAWVQPRAMIYRKKTDHLLVASEGMSRLVELDATSVAPGMVVNRIYRLGGQVTERLPRMAFTPRCGAPTGVALSDDEAIAYVYCRTTDELVAVRLTPDGERAHRDEISYIEQGDFHDKPSRWGPFAYASLAVPKTDETLALGRRLFFDATEPVVSEQMACAGCHPEGRDDGHVWREQEQPNKSEPHRFLAGPSLSQKAFDDPKLQRYGFARQTPMLAGRVKAEGPYGWHGESASLIDRIKAGFTLHRSMTFGFDGLTARMRAEPLARYLREGLVEPPSRRGPLTPEQEQGKQIFSSEKTGCATCHKPSGGEYTDRSVIPMVGYRTRPLFSDEENNIYKTPSLRHVGGSEPYLHDGSAPTLRELIDRNQNRMGKTSHLSEQERAALVAFLETL